MSGTVPPGAANRDNHFNFLRLCLAALVLLDHAPILVDGDTRRELLTRLGGATTLGDAAVSGFFALSGYLVVQSWQRRPRLGEFLSARALRIYPGFIVSSLVSVFVVGLIGAQHPWRYLARLDYPTLLQNLVLPYLPATPPTFVGSHFPNVNGSLWTICYECSCYLCAALLGVGGLTRRPRAFLACVLGLFALWLLPVYGVNLVFAARGLGLAWARQVLLLMILLKDNEAFLRLLFTFGVGGCFALHRERVRFSPGWAVVALAVVGVCLASKGLALPALTTLGAYALFTFAFLPIPCLNVFKGATDISYGVYLYGWPVQKLLLWTWPTMSPWTLFACSLVGSAVAGWSSWRWIERPFLRLRRRIGPAGEPAAEKTLPFASAPAQS